MQIQDAVPEEPPRVQACMDLAVEFVHAQSNRSQANGSNPDSNVTDDSNSSTEGSGSDTEPTFVAQMSPGAPGTPSDIPFQSYTKGDVVVGRIVLDARDMGARCVGLAKVTETMWQDLFTRIIAATQPEPPLPPSPLYGTLGATWLNSVKEATLSPGSDTAAGASLFADSAGSGGTQTLQDESNVSETVAENPQDAATAAIDALEASKEKWDALGGGAGSYGVSGIGGVAEVSGAAIPEVDDDTATREAAQNAPQNDSQPVNTLADLWDSDTKTSLTEEERQLADVLGVSSSEIEESKRTLGSKEDEKTEAKSKDDGSERFDPLDKKKSEIPKTISSTALSAESSSSAENQQWVAMSSSISIGSMCVTFLRESTRALPSEQENTSRVADQFAGASTVQAGIGQVCSERAWQSAVPSSEMASSSTLQDVEEMQATVVDAEASSSIDSGSETDKDSVLRKQTIKQFSTDAVGRLVEQTTSVSVSDSSATAAVTDASSSDAEDLKSYAVERTTPCYLLAPL